MDPEVIGANCLGLVVAEGFKGLGAISPQGSFKRNDIVCWRDPAVRLGRARFYYDMRFDGGCRRVVANVIELDKVTDTQWTDKDLHSHRFDGNATERWIDMCCLRTVTCVNDLGKLYPRFPFGAF